MSVKKARIAVLVSGGGTNLKAILDAGNRGEIPHGEVTLVISDRAGAYALERAAKAGIPALEINKKECGGQAAFEEKLIAALEENRTDLIVLAGFLSILTENFTSKYPRRIMNVHPSLIPSFCGAGFYGLKVHEAALEENRTDLIVLAGFLSILSEDFTSRWPRRIINVHPSLIPAFCGEGFYGLKVHEAALEKGVKVTGATVHFVNEIPDGGRIIAQKAVEVLHGDTPETLQRRVMEQAEWIILPRSVEKVCEEIMTAKED